VNTLKILDRPIAFHRCLVDLTENVAGALLLSQAIYWQNRCESEDGWWWKTAEQWLEETGLHRKEFESARRSCSEFLEHERRGIPAKCFYRVKHGLVQSRLSETGKLDCPKRANKTDQNGQSTSTETSSESTTERGSTNPPDDSLKPDTDRTPNGRFQPPDQKEFREYCAMRGMTETQAKKCFVYYSARHWMDRNGHVMDWKWLVIGWLTRDQEREQTKSKVI
jgi:hypothetical protein